MFEELIEQYEKSIAPKKPKAKASSKAKTKSETKVYATGSSDFAINSKTTDKVTDSVEDTQPLKSSVTEHSIHPDSSAQGSLIDPKAVSQNSSETEVPTNAKTTNQNRSETKAPKQPKAESRKSSETEIITSTKAHQKPWKTLTPRRKKIVLYEDKCCQHFDPVTGTICGSEFQLEVDHIQPKYAGGGNNRENLRALCRAHNQYRNRKRRRPQMQFDL